MKLPDELISQFVKATQDKRDEKGETIVYGTVVNYNGGIGVKLDGADSNTITPVSTTANVEVGERVTVMIKNHTATITGNLTSPSTNKKEVKQMVDKYEIFIGDLSEGITIAEEKANTANATANDAAKAAANASNIASWANATANLAAENAEFAAEVAAESGKTATNYLKFDTEGLLVGDLQADELKSNVLINAKGVNIRMGDATLASFIADVYNDVNYDGETKLRDYSGITSYYDTEFGTTKYLDTEVIGRANTMNTVAVDTDSFGNPKYESKSVMTASFNEPWGDGYEIATIEVNTHASENSCGSSITEKADVYQATMSSIYGVSSPNILLTTDNFVVQKGSTFYDILNFMDSFKVVTGTIASETKTWSVVNYPSGFSKDNCIVIGFEVNYQGSYWRSGIGMYGTGPTRLFVSQGYTYLGIPRIGVYTDATDTDVLGQQIRIALMRI